MLKAVAAPSPANQADIIKAEKKFLKFCSVYWITVFIAVLSTFLLVDYQIFWKGNILWATGSVMVFFSALHRSYFDIKKKGNPGNRGLEGCQFHPSLKKLEELALHAWVLGSLIILSSRWIHL